MTDRPEREVEGLVEMLEPNGRAGDVEMQGDERQGYVPLCQYFAAQAGPYEEDTPVVVMSADEAEEMADAIRTLTAERDRLKRERDEALGQVQIAKDARNAHQRRLTTMGENLRQRTKERNELRRKIRALEPETEEDGE